MRTIARSRYAGYRFPAEIISHAVWLYFRFPLGLRTVEEMLAARGITVSHGRAAEQIDGRRWTRKSGQALVNQMRRRLHERRHSRSRPTSRAPRQPLRVLSDWG